MLVVHVSAGEAIDGIRSAQTRGLKIYGETCPQYLFLTAKEMLRESAAAGSKPVVFPEAQCARPRCPRHTAPSAMVTAA